jgi:PleD family two-component response regulator
MSVTPLHSTDKIKILVVDDQPVNIQIIHQMLNADYQIFMATSGAQAITLCQNNPPDLILLDVLMPDLDGFATCRLLKQQPELAQIPVIFVTGMQSQEDETLCWEAGGADFVIKPVNALTLKHRIKTQLKLKQMQDLLQQLKG